MKFFLALLVFAFLECNPVREPFGNAADLDLLERCKAAGVEIEFRHVQLTTGPFFAMPLPKDPAVLIDALKWNSENIGPIWYHGIHAVDGIYVVVISFKEKKVTKKV